VLTGFSLREIVLRLGCPAAGELHVEDCIEPAAEQSLGGLLHHPRIAQRLQAAEETRRKSYFHGRAIGRTCPLSGHLPVPFGSAQ
jgi:hypothetical protein